MSDPEEKSNKIIRNVGKYFTIDISLHPRRFKSSRKLLIY